jgi:hypothetical protein
MKRYKSLIYHHDYSALDNHLWFLNELHRIFIFIFTPEIWNIILFALVAFAAGSLMGGALLHTTPATVEKMGNVTKLYVWLVAGFTLFLALKKFLNLHHSYTHSHSSSWLSPPNEHNMPCDAFCTQQTTTSHLQRNQQHQQTTTHGCRSYHNFRDTRQPGVGRNICWRQPSKFPATAQDGPDSHEEDSRNHSNNDYDRNPSSSVTKAAPDVSDSDCRHGDNFIGGMIVGASFVDCLPLGVSLWLVAVTHEIPQELGGFVIFVHSGWSKRQALACVGQT